MKKLFVLLITFIFVSLGNTYGQNGTLKGGVLDKDNNEGIPFARIDLKQDSITVIRSSSDFDGNYSIKSIPSGFYDLQVSSVGYLPILIRGIQIHQGKIEFLDVQMTMSTVVLEELEVLDYMVPLISKDNTTSGATVTKEEIARMPNANANSLATTVGGTYGQRSKKSNNNFVLLEDVDLGANAGTLTATEINDFSKWDLWMDIGAKELSIYKDMWRIYPEKRYSVQVITKNNLPIANAEVWLENRENIVYWKSKTDNTGKAELWYNFYENQKSQKDIIRVRYDGQVYFIGKPKMIQKGINIIKLPVDCKTSDEVDIAFVIDATGSMDDEIDFLKTDLLDIIGHTKEAFPEVDLHLGSVFYRCQGNEYVTRLSEMSSDVNKTISFIQDQDAGQGGDEAVEEALQAAIEELEWRPSAHTKILFFILDEQPLTNREVMDKMHYYIKEASALGIRIVPIIASAEKMSHSKSLEFLMRSMALATNGTAFMLTNHSGIGNDHATPTTDVYDVELLNSIIKRIIYQYSYMPDCDDIMSIEDVSDTTFVYPINIIAHEIVDSTRTIEHSEDKIYITDLTTDTIIEVKENDTSFSKEVSGGEDLEKPGVFFYPNPTKGPIRVNISGAIEELFIFDISGKLMMRFELGSKTQLKIDLSDYSTGLYFLKYRYNSKWNTGRIVLTR